MEPLGPCATGQRHCPAHGRGLDTLGAGRRESSALLLSRVPDAGLRPLKHPYLCLISTGPFHPSLAQRVCLVFTPRRLNMAEPELSVLTRQALSPRRSPRRYSCHIYIVRDPAIACYSFRVVGLPLFGCSSRQSTGGAYHTVGQEIQHLLGGITARGPGVLLTISRISSTACRKRISAAIFSDQ